MKRLALCAMISALIAAWLAAEMTYRDPGRLRSDSDFPAFYNAGRIVSTHPQGALYDQDRQRGLYFELVPNAHPLNVRYFAYSPFFALVFVPIARLSYLPALFCWIVLTALLFVAGFHLTWMNSGLAHEHKVSSFLICFSFLPFFAWGFLSPQTSVIAFFALALTIYLDGRGQFILSGLALSMLLYKPPLLILLIPMLLVTKRWRTLAGFVVGASILGIVSLAVVGVSGIKSYLDMLRMFAELKASGGRPTYMEIDAYSFFFGLTQNRRLSTAFLALVCVIVLPLLVVRWWRDREASWSDAITWTIVLNFYVLIYDATLMILAVLVSPIIFKTKAAKWLLIVLFVAPWFQKLSVFGFQPMTVAVVAIGSYQLLLSSRSVLWKFPLHSSHPTRT